MADPLYDYIDETGVVVPDTSTLQGDVQTEFQNALGADLVLTPNTPQGVLITAEVTARDAVVRNNAALANQINPNLAGGVFLDAICALTGLERDKGTYSIIQGVSLTGVASTVIPSGVQAKTTNGDIFASLGAVVLDVSGNATVDFRAVEIGGIGATIGSLNQIVTGVLGWENVINSNAAILGQTEQSDQALRTKRRNTLALQGVALPEAITSALYDVPGVNSLVFRENVTAATKVIDGVSLVAHSIYVDVDGGVDEDIALALLENKSLGADWNGNTTVVVVEPVSGQPYTVKFSRPDEIDILMKVTVVADSSLLDPQTAVRNSIMNYVNGLMEGEVGFVVGGNVSSFELASAINRDNPSIFVQNLQTTVSTSISYSSDEIVIEIYQIARTNPSSIQVIIA